jgi:glycosyltransferase involved in cell wall biosynthesis
MPQTLKFFEDPRRMLRSVVLVLKAKRSGEKGVIVILYTYALPLFAKLFDVDRISRDYYLVLEPSWSGYCDADILCYSQLDCPVFLQSYEPRDTEFVQGLGANFVTVPVSNNWWVDHRVFKPMADVKKEVDVIMIAAWADFKRHPRFFGALRRLRQRGIKLKVALVGYPVERTRAWIAAEAAHFGVDSQIEMFEWIPREEVNAQLNRAKVNVLWSRREGFNRAIIEGMFAGVPCIMREGFNYGYQYPYINSSTGCFSSEAELPAKLVSVIERYQAFSPREWVFREMSCQRATEILSRMIRDVAVQRGETWTEELVVKVNGLHGMEYWSAPDEQRFVEDYEFLASTVRKELQGPGV